MLAHFLVTIAVGAISGWIAGKLMGSDGSLLRNIIIGVIGGVIGGFLGGFIGIGATNLIGKILISVAGTCLLIWLSKKLL